MSDIIIKYKVKGLTEIRAAFKQAPFKLTVEIGKAIGRIIGEIESDAKREAPVNKRSGGGNLRQSIRSRMTGVASGIVDVGANYAMFVHGGTRPHIIRIRTKKVLADKRSGRIFGTVVKHPGTKANPFLQRAIDKNSSFIDRQFADAVGKAIK